MFYAADQTPPTRLETTEFMLRPLRTTDVERDYEAVIASRPDLLLRSHGEWPREGFTLAENLADLEQHQQEHEQGIAFTYTVLHPTESECLGCVYITPLSYNQERTGVPEEAPEPGSAAVTFWIRSSRLADRLDERFFAALLDWLRTAWHFPAVYVVATRAQTRQIELCQRAGLEQSLSFPRAVGFRV